jgi:hypothetical protein
MSHVCDHPIKPRAESQNLFQVPLNIVEKGIEGGEGIGHCIRATMFLQSCQHFKTFAMIESPLILKEKTQRTLPNSNPELTLPEETGCRIGWACDKSVIRTFGRILRKMEIKLDQVLEVQISLGVLDLRKLEGVRRSKRHCQGKGRW